MKLNQISVFLENRAGQLAEVTSLISSHKLVLRAVSIAETADYGILRLLADDPAKVAEVLRGAGIICTATPVTAVKVSDEAGGLSMLLDKVARAGINVKYMYSVYSLQDKAPYMVLRVEDNGELEKLEASLA